MKRLTIFALCLALILPGTASAAVYNLARDYIPAPPGTLAFLSYYQFISGQNTFANGQKVGRDLGLTEHVGLFRPIYYTDVNIPLPGDRSWNIVFNPQFIIPFGTVSVNAGPGNRPGATSFNASSTGFGDALWFATFWLIHNDEQKFYLGFTPIFITPTGTYSRSRLLNFGGQPLVVR